MPTVQGTDDFTSVVAGSYDAFFNVDGVDPSGVSSPLYQSRGQSLQISPTGSNEGVRHNVTGSPTRGWTAFPYRITAAPSGGQGILRLHSNTTNVNASISVTAGLVSNAFIGAGGGVTGPTFSIDTWYWIEAIYNVITTTHTLLWRVNGVDQTPATVAGTALDSVTYAQLFSTSGGATWYAGGYWKWGSAASDADWLGEPAAATTEPGYQRIVGPAQLAAAAATVYTVPTGMKAELRSVDLNNPSGSLRKVTVSIGSDAAGTRVVNLLDIPAGGSLNLRREINHTLLEGETLQAYADSASVVVATIDANVEEL